MKLAKKIPLAVVLLVPLLFGLNKCEKGAMDRAIVSALIMNGRQMSTMIKEPPNLEGMREWPILPPKSFPNSTEYFRYMVETGMMDVAWNFFIAPGMHPASDTSNFCASNNIWCVVVEHGNATCNYPLCFTRNLSITSLSQRVFTLESISKKYPPGVVVIMNNSKGMFLRTEKEVRDLLDQCQADNRVLRP